MRFIPNYRGRRGAAPRRYQDDQVGKKIASGVKGIQKSLDTIDKLHEAKLENSGLLSGEEFTHDLVTDIITDADTGVVTPVTKNIDIFQRVDKQGFTLNPYKYAKSSLKGTYGRVGVNPDFFTGVGPDGPKTFKHVSEMLGDKGFSHKAILDIAQNTPGVEIMPWDYEGDLTDMQILGEEPGWIGDKLSDAKSWLKDLNVSDAGQQIMKLDVLDDFAQLSSSIKGQASSLVKDLKFVGSSVWDAGADFAGDIASEFADVVGDKTADAIASGVKSAADAGMDIASETAGKVLSGVGDAAGTVTAGVSAVKGVKRSGEGLADMGEALTDADNFAESAAAVVKGGEEVIQGGIEAASPALIKAGPGGWIVLGVSMAEDLLLDEDGLLGIDQSDIFRMFS
tara:strand:+ start:6206 stop:7393 length:1188 start_codon:yes stop_codon:yes gene_type:complete